MAQQSAEFVKKVDESHKGQEEDKQKPQEENQQKQEKNEAQTTENIAPSLFGSMTNGQNLFNNNQTTSIFQGSLFGSSQPTTGLFSQGPSILSNNVDLSKPGPSLFGISYKAPKSDESDGGDDGALEEPKPEDDEPKQIIMKYDYQSNTEQLVKVNVEKFRKNNNDILEKGSVAIEKVKSGDSYYVVYRNAIQQSLYTGQLLKGFSLIKPLGQKPENLIVKAISRKEKQDSKQGQQGENDEKNSLSVDTLKLMFTTKEGSEEFKAEFAKIFQ